MCYKTVTNTQQSAKYINIATNNNWATKLSQSKVCCKAMINSHLHWPLQNWYCNLVSSKWLWLWMLPLAGQVKARKTGGNREYLCWLSDPQYPKAQGLIGTPKKRKEKKRTSWYPTWIGVLHPCLFSRLNRKSRYWTYIASIGYLWRKGGLTVVAFIDWAAQTWHSPEAQGYGLGFKDFSGALRLLQNACTCAISSHYLNKSPCSRGKSG